MNNELALKIINNHLASIDAQFDIGNVSTKIDPIKKTATITINLGDNKVEPSTPENTPFTVPKE